MNATCFLDLPIARGLSGTAWGNHGERLDNVFCKRSRWVEVEEWSFGRDLKKLLYRRLDASIWFLYTIDVRGITKDRVHKYTPKGVGIQYTRGFSETWKTSEVFTKCPIYKTP